MGDKVKVLFSNPPWWIKKSWMFGRWIAGVRAGSRWPFTLKVWSRPDLYVFGDYTPYPFFMGYATTYLESKTNAEVIFRDSIAIKESYEKYWKFIQEGEFEYIIIESATPSWGHDKKLIRHLAEISPTSKIIITGPISSAHPEEILNNNQNVIACIKGEYEKGVVSVVLEGARGVLEHNLLSEAEMNKAPFPYFDKLHARKYFDFNPRWQKYPHVHVWSSRGCPFKCIFCVWPATMTGNDPDGTNVRKVRHYSPEYMEAFLKKIIDLYGFKSIYFDDDTFNLGKSHVEGICNIMQKIGLPWSAMCRPDLTKKDTWKLMKESGCFGVKLGFESGNQYVVDKIVNKHLDLDESSKNVHYLKSIGMKIHGTFTYGLPGETKEQMMDTKKYIESLPFDSVQESGTAEIEGTPLHELRKRGRLSEYSGAEISKNYIIDIDGNEKWDKIDKKINNT